MRASYFAVRLGGAVPLLAILSTAACLSAPESPAIEQTEEQSAALDNRPGWLFGVRCQQDYQNNWDPTISAYGMCSKFINGINGSNLDHVGFYYNLHGAQNDIQTTWDTCYNCGGVDSVDFFMLYTHGGIDSSQARFAMWDSYTRAWTGSMRIGDNGRQAKVLATYACDTLAVSDGNFFNRWQGVLDGGLKIVVGAYDLLYDGNDQKGTEFSSRLEGGEPVGFAWNEAVWYADNSNHPLAVATGANSADCTNRRQANLATALSMPRLQDAAWQYACWSGWN